MVAWPLSAASGRNDGLGITTPSKNVVNYLFAGDSSFLDWGALLFTTLGVWGVAKFHLAPSTQGTTVEPLSDRASAPRIDTGHESVLPAARPAAGIPAVDVGLRPATPTRAVHAVGEGHYGLDSRGDVCPFPLLKLKNAVDTLQTGEHITVIFDCTQATDAIPAWAAENGHSVRDFVQRRAAEWEITLQVGAPVS